MNDRISEFLQKRVLEEFDGVIKVFKNRKKLFF